MSNPLPEFDRPPVDEVVMGIQFDPLKDFHAAHVGLYWARIRERYPILEDQPPLAPQIEQVELKPQAVGLSFQPGPWFPRCWFIEGKKNELIQFQWDRFLRNWRRIEGKEPYPRFSYLIKKYKDEWEEFLEFLNEEEFKRPNVNQCELTYINHLEPGSGWDDYSEVGSVFTTLRSPGPGILPAPELLTWDSRYILPGGRGRLYAQVQPSFRARDLKLILSFTLTARGAPAGTDDKSIFAWFDLAHEWIVRGFDQLTQPNMHKFWGKKQ